ncbi:MAG: hypothetical protein EOM28_04595 [Clostridia bacterium]|nr:hypothetical protein [Clostridia bacterium]
MRKNIIINLSNTVKTASMYLHRPSPKSFFVYKSLLFTCLAIFLVYIPSILSGQNIYVSTLVICGFITIMTIMITNGWSKNFSHHTWLSVWYFHTTGLSLLTDNVLPLTGVTDEKPYLSDRSAFTPKFKRYYFWQHCCKCLRHSDGRGNGYCIIPS